MYFVTSLKVCVTGTMMEVSSEHSRSQFYAYRVLPPLLLLLCALLYCLLLLQQQCCCFLLLFVVVCRIATFVAGSLNLHPTSLITGMRGAKAGVSSPRPSPPLYQVPV